MQKINIAIDGYVATGKSSIGQKLAERFGYTLIDSGLFYRYFASIYYADITQSINTDKESFLENPKIFIENINLYFNDQRLYLESGKKASMIAQDPNIREVITQLIRDMTKEKGFIVTGRDATTNILPEAEVKITLSAEFVERVKRRMKQTNLPEHEVVNDIFERDRRSFQLIEQAKKKSVVIETTELDIDSTLEKILLIITKRITTKEKYLKILFIFVFIVIYYLFYQI
jgi:cytidylate kinase